MMSAASETEVITKLLAFFRTVAIAVGDALGYAYLYDLDERVTRYLLSIRNESGLQAAT